MGETLSILAAATAFDLTAALVQTPSISHHEAAIADLVCARLRARAPHLRLDRLRNNVVARTPGTGRPRILLAGHLDTVPGDPAAVRVDADRIAGLGAVDMKGGIATMLMLAEEPAHGPFDLAFVFYDAEETGSFGSGMRLLFDEHPDWVHGDVAVLLEPTAGRLEAGCQGNLVVEFGFEGARAHTARPWRGVNAVHRSIPALTRLAGYAPPVVHVDGLAYRQSISVVSVAGGVQGNVVPDQCSFRVNFRHAPGTGSDAALAELTRLVGDADSVKVRLSSPPAPPHLNHPLLTRLRDAGRLEVRPKLGWTDVGRFAEHGIPAINFGPGDSELAHTPHEVVDRVDLERCVAVLRSFLHPDTATAPTK
jgi:succinyl-diaminopimelate desuccinylase